MSFTLRDYQQAAVDKTYEYWSSGKGKNPLIIAPTAAGKSLIIAQIAKDVCQYPDDRVLVLTHRKELIKQNYDKLINIWPDADAGIFSSGLKKKQMRNRVTFAGVQSIWNKIHKGDPYSVVMIDEAHLIPQDATTRYGQAIDILRKMNPQTAILGLTATPYRLNSGYLYEGKDAIFDGVSYEISLRKLLDDGWICPIISKGGVQKIDLSNVHKRGGEYIQSELAFAASDPALVQATVAEIVAYGENRPGWLIFASGVAHAHMVRDEISSHGISAAVLTGETDKKARDKITSDFVSGALRCVVNVDVLTAGFDAPICSLIAMLRSTMSTSLYVQCLGRGMRLYPGKDNCLFLDYGSNAITHGPLDDLRPIIKGASDGTGESPARECPQCKTHVHAAIRQCPDCGYEWPLPAFNHGTRAYEGAILKDQIKPTEQMVNIVYFHRHKKNGKPDSLRVSYVCGMSVHNEWLSFESESQYARKKAFDTIREFGGIATTVDEALAECGEYKWPTRILTMPDGKYTKITKRFYDYVEDPGPEEIYEKCGTYDDVPF